ncbi:MAG: cold shock domain-containing protein [Bacteroidetes bacterium]|nr:cold shock domain-containing protein [Bacteroidota bacterium]
MGRSQESFNKKDVRTRKEKKRKEKEKKRAARKENEKNSSLDDMIAYVDEHGRITDTPPDPAQKEVIKAEDIVISVPIQQTKREGNQIRKGVVSFFNDSKGYGFIKDLESKASVFVHVNNTEEDIKEGNLVVFEVGAGQKGPSAMNVKLFRESEEEK